MSDLFDETRLLQGGSLPATMFVSVSTAITLYNIYKKHKCKQLLLGWFAQMSSIPEANINMEALLTSLHRLNIKVGKARRETKSKLLETNYSVPTNTISSSTASVPNVKFDQFEKSCAQLTITSLSNDLALSKKLEFQKQEELNNKEEALLEVTCKLTQQRVAFSQSRRQNRDSVKKVDRLKRKIDDKKEICDTLQSEIENLTKEGNKSKKVIHKVLPRMEARVSHLSTLKGQIKQLQQQQIKSDKLVLSLESKNSQLVKQVIEINDQLGTANKQLDNQKREIVELVQDRDYLHSLLQDNSSFCTMDDGKQKFNSATVQVVMDLLDCGVATQQVATVIKNVCNYCGKEPDQLPTRQTVDNMNLRRLALAQQQIGESQSKSDLTLYTDETSKYGSQYMVYATTDDKAPMVLGIKPIPSKSAQDTLNTMIELLSEISTTCNEEKLGEKLIINLKNTMSDRASTEKLFNVLLEQYRSSILDKMLSLENLPSDKIDSLKKVNNFFCGLHLLISLAENTSKVMVKIEKDQLEGPIGAGDKASTKFFCKKTESAVMRSIRTSCNLLSRGGDNKSGCFADFTAYLSQKEKHNSLTQFRHNRFNIVFHNAGSVYFLAEDIISFLSDVHGTPNTLAEAVHADVKEVWCLAGFKAIGLLGKCVTSPLWRLLEDKTLHISQMSRIYTDLVSYLKASGGDEDDVLSNGILLGNGPQYLQPYVQRDSILDKLVETRDFDDKVRLILKDLTKHWAIQLEPILSSYLPGGEYHSMTEEQVQETRSVVKHNKLAEELFGQLDRLMGKRPIATILTNEAHIMFKKNRTADWLKSKSQAQQNLLIQESWSKAQKLKKHYQLMTASAHKRRKSKLLEKAAKIERLRKVRFQQRETLTQNVIDVGLWQCDDDVHSMLTKLKTNKDKKKAIQHQLNFRRTILKQPASDLMLFKFSSKKGPFSVEQMTNHLLKLIKEAQDTIPRHVPETAAIVGQNIHHRFEVANTGTSELRWFQGFVSSQVPGFPAWCNIMYTDQPGVRYSYQLLEDIAAGDVLVQNDRKSIDTEVFYRIQISLTIWIRLHD